jgi:AraC-like DNA-binding protein
LGELLTVESSDVADVEQTWRAFVPSAALQRVEPRAFRFAWTSSTVPGFTALRYDLAASTQSVLHPADELLACRVASRSAAVGIPRRELNAGMPWLGVEGPMRVRWHERAEVRAFVFDRTFAEDGARQITGDDRFQLRNGSLTASPQSRQVAAQWERAFVHVAGSLFGPDDASPLVEAELRRHALHTTLIAFSPAFTAALERSAQRSAAPRAVRRALAYIEEHAHEPITVDDVANAADISTRGLQYAFRRALGVTPTEYLRSERLARAHAELQQGTRLPVADIARRWGFASPSRFAKHYREAYGRSPRQTLRG